MLSNVVDMERVTLGIGDRIKKLRKRSNLTQSELADKISVSSQVVSNWERGYTGLDIDDIRRLSFVLDTSADYLLGDDDPLPSNIKEFDPDQWRNLPIIGSIAAGEPITRIEHIEGYQLVPRNVVDNKEAFVLRVKGDSMIGDNIQDGTLVACISQPEVENGEIAVVSVRDEEATLKRVEYENGFCFLMPSNPNMRPIIEKAQDIHIIGKAVMYTGYL